MAASKSIKFGSHLKELRIHLCQKSKESLGIRQFIENHYVPLKQANPSSPILVRECSGILPKLYARYEEEDVHVLRAAIFKFGQEKSVSVSNLSKDQVAAQLKSLCS